MAGNVVTLTLYHDPKKRGEILPGSSEERKFKQLAEHYSKFYFAQEQKRF